MLLPWLILIPFIGGFLCWQTERFGVKVPRWIALITMGLTLALGLQLWMQGGYSLTQSAGIPQWQSEFVLPWIPRFGISIHLAIDGLSLLMVVLTGLLGVLAVLCSWREIEKYQGFFHLSLMWILGGVIGVFLAIDMFLFFFFWEMMLVPMYFLIALWGHKASDGKTRITAATKFFIYTQASGLVMLIAILALAFVHFNATGVWTFNYEDLLKTPMSHGVGIPADAGLLHRLRGENAGGTAARLAAGRSLSGADCRFRRPRGHLAENCGLRSAALCAAAVPERLRRVCAHRHVAGRDWYLLRRVDGLRPDRYQTSDRLYLRFPHGFRADCYLHRQPAGLSGAVIQMIAHGLSAAGLFILCGQLYERLHTRDMRQMGGLWSKIKWLPAMSMFFAVATLGMPGTGNFVGEFMILFGSYKVVPVITVISTFGLVFASVYSLSMLHRAYFGKAKSEIAAKALPGMSLRELSIILLLVVLLVLLGFFPQPILDTSHAAMSNIQQWFVNSVSTTRP